MENSDSDRSDRDRLKTPMWCPICDLTMRDDPRTYYRWGCCIQCFIEFIEHREDRWSDGWRPSSEEVLSFLEKVRGRGI